MPRASRAATRGRSGYARAALCCGACSRGGLADGSARTRRWRPRPARTRSCSETCGSGSASVARGLEPLGGLERLGEEGFDAREVGVRVCVARADVVRVRHDPQLLWLFGGLEQTVGVTDRDDL